MKNLYIFDCYGVLISPVAIRWFKAHYPKDLYMEKYYFFMDGVDMGYKSFEQVMIDLEADTGINRREIKRSWLDLVVINYPIFEKIKELRKTGFTALLSNAPHGLVEEIFKEHRIKITDYFDKKFISADYHMMKPDLRFYQVCLDAYKDEKLNRITMCDDRIENLKDLPSIGIEPILFENNEKTLPKL